MAALCDDSMMSFSSKTGDMLGWCQNSHKIAQIREYGLKLV